MATCGGCGAVNPDHARFCNACGRLLAVAEGAGETRKRVSVLFCDVTGSTALGEQLDPESLRRVLARYFEAMRGVVERHGGTVEKFIGDAVMAVFGVPRVHEDDALRAVRAAWDMTTAIDALNAELNRDFGTTLQVRIGVNTGEVVTGTAERLATGDVVNVAARLEQAGEPGAILIGVDTLELAFRGIDVAAVEPLILKGKSQPIRAYRVLGVRGETEVGRATEVPIIGRVSELSGMQGVQEQVVAEGCCRLFSIAGAAGVGKSRIARAFLADLGITATVLRGRCLSYGEGVTYWPIIEMLTPFAERIRQLDLETDAMAVIDHLITGFGTPTTDEISWAFRKLLETEAREHPLIVVFDDIQWAEDTLLDLIEQLPLLSHGAAILVVCLTRPELFDKRPGWTIDLRLPPLGDGEAEALMDRCLGDIALNPPMRRQVLTAAGGNPLFVEEMTAMAQTSGDAGFGVPASINALIAARLDQLPPDARAVLACAAVEGEVFHRGALKALSGDGNGMSRALSALAKQDFIAPHQPQFPSEDAFRFRHLLIRDVAYDSTPKAARATLHERFAGWLEAKMGDGLAEAAAICGYHLEQAFSYRAELGPITADTRALGRRAGNLLGSAGERAAARGDFRAAVSLLKRAVATYPADDRERSLLLSELGEALISAGNLTDAATALVEAEASGLTHGYELAVWRSRIAQARLRRMAGVTSVDEAIATARSAASRFAALEDHLGMARAWLLIGFLIGSNGISLIDADLALEQALEHARRADAPREIADAVTWGLGMAWFGPTPAHEGIARCRAVLQDPANRSVEANAHLELGCFLAMRGDCQAARASCARGLALLEDLGNTLMHAAGAHAYFDTEMLCGDPRAAEQLMRSVCSTLEAMGERGFLSTRLGYLAEALYVQGRFDEADVAARQAEAISDPSDADAQFRWRSVRARLLARNGDFAAAEALIIETVKLPERAEMLNDMAAVRVAYAEILEVAGRSAEAGAESREALRLYELKSNDVAAARVRASLGSDGPSAPP